MKCDRLRREPCSRKRLEYLLQRAEEVRQAYLTWPMPKIADVGVMLDWTADDGHRHFAYYREDQQSIHLSPALCTYPVHVQFAMIGHEFGHAADFLYPASWHDGEFYDTPVQKTRWRQRSRDAIEQSADAIAETVMGIQIHYTTNCLVQSTKGGIRPRPEGLR